MCSIPARTKRPLWTHYPQVTPRTHTHTRTHARTRTHTHTHTHTRTHTNPSKCSRFSTASASAAAPAAPAATTSADVVPAAELKVIQKEVSAFRRTEAVFGANSYHLPFIWRQATAYICLVSDPRATRGHSMLPTRERGHYRRRHPVSHKQALVSLSTDRSYILSPKHWNSFTGIC